MSIQLNHTIVAARDKAASARFLAGLLGLEVGAPYGPFIPVTAMPRSRSGGSAWLNRLLGKQSCFS